MLSPVRGSGLHDIREVVVWQIMAGDGQDQQYKCSLVIDTARYSCTKFSPVQCTIINSGCKFNNKLCH